MKGKTTLALVWLFIATASAAPKHAVLHGIIIDGSSRKPTPATVAITDANAHLVFETDSFKGGFRCEGEFIKELPPGRTRIRVTRGFETQLLEQELDLKEEQRTNVTFLLSRVVDLRKQGWYAGDSHVHMLHGERTVPVSFDFVDLTAKAEDLQYMSLAQAWDLADPTPEALAGELRPRSTPDCVLTWNLEAPKNYYRGDAARCLGHCWNLGVAGRTAGGADVVQSLMDASAWDYESQKPSYANFESHRLIHQQHGAVFYTHPARWWTGTWGGKAGYPKIDRMRISNMAVELPLDTVVGPTFDGLDVITGPGEFEANEKAFSLWAMLLNHGYRLAATGSSDACFDRVGGATPGTPRIYTYLPHGFSLAKVTQATAAGHTFVTTGPLLLATIDGKPPGSTFSMGHRKHDFSIEAWASGDTLDGLARLEILRNGQVFTNCEFSTHPRFVTTGLTFQEQESGWYCVRLWQSGSKNRRAISGAFYFGPYHPPLPVQSKVRIHVVDGLTGERIPARLTEVEFAGTLEHDKKRYNAIRGEAEITISATARLRAEAQGYRAEVLSPLFDNPRLIKEVTTLSDADLLEWKTFKEMRRQMSNVDLEFKLERNPR